MLCPLDKRDATARHCNALYCIPHYHWQQKPQRGWMHHIMANLNREARNNR